MAVHQVQGFGGFFQVANQFIAWNAGKTLTAALAESVPQVSIGQLHDDDELAIDCIETFKGENIGVADLPNSFERFQFLFGRPAILIHSIEVAKDKLGSLQKSARRFNLPNFSKSASTQALDQPVPSQWAWKFFLADQTYRHLGNRQSKRKSRNGTIPRAGVDTATPTISLAQTGTFGKKRTHV